MVWIVLVIVVLSITVMILAIGVYNLLKSQSNDAQALRSVNEDLSAIQRRVDNQERLIVRILHGEAA